MSQVAEPDDAPGRLRADMGAMKNRRLARLILGPEATAAQVENKRIQIRKWKKKKPGTYLLPKNAQEVGRALGTDPARYMKPPVSQLERLEAEAARHERLAAEIRREQRALSRAPERRSESV